jgi:2-keto-4-pentenoate hydratase/2-oxohepta-3-ene-1,7-dioic acid hydratase in catechol pathway
MRRSGADGELNRLNREGAKKRRTQESPFHLPEAAPAGEKRIASWLTWRLGGSGCGTSLSCLCKRVAQKFNLDGGLFMRIIRFMDADNVVRYGYDYADGSAAILEGNPLLEIRKTGDRKRVRKLLAPLEPAAILCIGLNYHHHAQETGAAIPSHPVLFMKNPAALNNPEDPIVLPSSCLDPPQVDYEAELAVVIGKAAKNVPAAHALEHVFGYTAGNDVSARRWQKHGGGGQWVLGKSFDTFCPLGPALATADEIPDPQSLQLQCILNGRIMQDANTADMIFSVARLIEFLSTGMTLKPGTVILTGTPSGVGFVRKPPVYLKAKDKVEVRIERIGSLVNPVIEEGG